MKLIQQHGRGRAKSRKGQKGMTLIELMASVAILTGALVSLAAVSTTTHRLRRTVFEKRTVLAGIELQMSAIKATEFDLIDDQHHGRDFAITLEGSNTPVLNALRDDPDGLPGQVTVRALTKSKGEVSLWEVTVSVTWFGVSGERTIQRAIRLSRLGSS